MAQIFCIANQKGGVGKTTTAVNLAGALALKGRRVLFIDLDPQGNGTMGCGIEKRDLKGSIYEVLLGSLNKAVGVAGADALARIFAFILICLGVAIFWQGFSELWLELSAQATAAAAAVK